MIIHMMEYYTVIQKDGVKESIQYSVFVKQNKNICIFVKFIRVDQIINNGFLWEIESGIKKKFYFFALEGKWGLFTLLILFKLPKTVSSFCS